MNNKLAILFWILIALALNLLLTAGTESNVNEDKLVKPRMVSNPPVIDGNLDDEAWAGGYFMERQFTTFSPTIGGKLPMKTKVWIVYDPENIYIAFYCYDDNPEKIVSAVRARDNIFDCDWVNVALDPVGNRQKGYEFVVNPHGIQGDVLMVGNDEDSSPDWVWYSAAKIVKDGYIVEMHIPLSSLRYTSGKNVEYGIMFYRHISRLNLFGSWPAFVPGTAELNAGATLLLGEVKSQNSIEILPSLTYGTISERKSESEWNDSEENTEFGIDFKYALSSSITAEATINPDFSQVESDEFHVMANRRYPIFYSEKRPFFMGARNMFDIAGSAGFTNLSTAVHTRTIVDPAWGLRLTGETGNLSFGFLSAGDEWINGDADDSEDESNVGNALFIVGRGKYSLGAENYLGALFSSRTRDNQSNYVFGGDALFRFGDYHSLKGFYLISESEDDSGFEKSGEAWTIFYGLNHKHWIIEAVAEHIDKDFQMDTAFIKRSGITEYQVYLVHNMYPKEYGVDWLLRVNPWGYIRFTTDEITDLTDELYILSLDFTFPLRGLLSITYNTQKEAWLNNYYDQYGIDLQGRIQPWKWFSISANISVGEDLYYSRTSPLVGDSCSASVSIRFEPSKHFKQDIGIDYANMKYPNSEENIYDLVVLTSRTTFQINKHLFLRALIQYDSYMEVVLTDFLASFTWIPGTVLHIGYGSLYEKGDYMNNQWTYGTPQDKYYQTTRSFFMKASYRFQL